MVRLHSARVPLVQGVHRLLVAEYDKLTLENPQQLEKFFDVYVKLMEQTAVGLGDYIKHLLSMMIEAKLEGTASYKELNQVAKMCKLQYSSEFLSYYSGYVKENSDDVGKILSMYESKSPVSTEEDRLSHAMSKVYQSMAFEDLMRHNSSDLPVHAVLEKELRSFAAALMSLWFAIFSPMFILQRKLLDHYRQIHRTHKKERILQQIFGSQVVDPELGAYNNEDSGTTHRTIAREKRKNGFFKQLLEFNSLKVEDEKYYLQTDLLPIIFEETFIRFADAEKMHEISIMDDTETAEETRSNISSKLM